MIAVTAASGKLGGLVLEGLLKAFPPGELVAIATQGVHVRRGGTCAVSQRAHDDP
jgi:uncharacterized protein YbjT (DUF2867 family)